MTLIQLRDIFVPNRTLALLYWNNQPLRFGTHQVYTCEDTARPDGVKIDKQTAIPAGDYFITITPSNRFKCDMPLIFNQWDKVDGGIVVSGHKRWIGIRQHIANTELDVEGCQAVGFDRDPNYGVKNSGPCWEQYWPWLQDAIRNSPDQRLPYKIINQQS